MQLDLGMGKPAASIFHFSVHSVDFRNVLTLLFGDRQGHPACNKFAIHKILFGT